MVFLAGAVVAHAQAPVQITPAQPVLELSPGGTGVLRLNVEIAEPYHIYSTVSQLSPKGVGPTATSVVIKESVALALDGAPRPSPAQKHYDPNFETDVLTLEGRAWIDLPLKAAPALAAGAHEAIVVVNYQACTAESCLPPEDATVRFKFVVASRAVAKAPDSEADRAYEEFRVVRYTQVPRMSDVKESSRLQRKQHDESSRLAEKFYDQFPNDSRKWEILGAAVNSPRQFTGPNAEAERAAWEKKRNTWRKMLLADASVPENIWTKVAEWTIGDMAGLRGKAVADLTWAGQVVEQMAVRVPMSDRRKFAEQTYLDALEKRDPAATEKFLRSRLTPAEKNQSVRDAAAGRLRIIEAARAPLDLKFTAADGREVDLAKLRGKVILIDFWATWCVPCIEEMPHVKAAYAKYHDKGFEVIGIAFENSLLAKTDTPEVVAQKKQVAKEKMLKFTAENGMPWPHHFDGDYWDNEFGRRFAIHSIPAVFLIGKDGRMVTTDAHGADLEPAVKRGLGL